MLTMNNNLQSRGVMQPQRKQTQSHGLLLRISSIPALHAAWRKVRANRGSAGADAVSIRAFERNLAANLKELGRNLLDKSYDPLPARPVCVLKRRLRPSSLRFAARLRSKA